MPEALGLFIESSTPRASLALVRGSEILFEEAFTGDRSHNALLFAPLGRALGCLPAGERLAAVVIGTGPGSYSGTRVGIAAGQGVALVQGCPALGLSSLLAVPAAADGDALAVGDARRGAVWRIGTAELRGGGEPRLCGLEELAGEIRVALQAGQPVFSLESLAGTGLHPDLATAVRLERPDAVLLAAAWRNLPDEERRRIGSLPPQPAYLRPPHVTVAKQVHPLLRK